MCAAGCHRENYFVLVIVLVVSFVFADQGCDEHFSSANGLTGQFSSPNYPSPYTAYQNCKIVLRATPDERIRITFTHFDLRPGNNAGCLFDYVEIFTIGRLGMKHVQARICGTAIPQPIISVHQTMEMTFHSDYADGSYTGFEGNYEFIDEHWNPFPSSSNRCSQYYNTGTGGELTSPGFPTPYANHVECTWLIRVNYEEKILVNFIELNMGESSLCTTTFVSIYNGFANPGGIPDEKVCGQLSYYDRNYKEFASDSYRIMVRFRADDNRVGSSGFRLSWTAVSLPKFIQDEHGNYVESPCPGFHCKGGEYCIDTDGLLCNPLPRYCIDASLRCDHIYHCGVNDKSDEEVCPRVIALLTFAVCGPLILTTVVAVLVIRHIRRRQLKGVTTQTPATATTTAEKRNTSKEANSHNLYVSPPSRKASTINKSTGRKALDDDGYDVTRTAENDTALAGEYAPPAYHTIGYSVTV